MKIALIEEGTKMKLSGFDKVVSFSKNSYVNASDYFSMDDYFKIYDEICLNLHLWLKQHSRNRSFAFLGTDILESYGVILFNYLSHVCQKEHVVQRIIEREHPTELWLRKNNKAEDLRYPYLDIFISDFISSEMPLKYFRQEQAKDINTVHSRNGESSLLRLSGLAKDLLNNLHRSKNNKILICSDLNKIPLLLEYFNGRDVIFLRERLPLRCMPYLMKRGIALKLLSDFKLSVCQKESIEEQANGFIERLSNSSERIIVGSGDFAPYIRRYLVAVWKKELRYRLETVLQAHMLFKRYPIRTLMVDEDRNVFNSLLVQVADQYKCTSYVNCHGEPLFKMGYLPLFANYIFVWGKAQKKLLNEWGLEKDKIIITGCAKYDKHLRVPSALAKKKICRDLKLSLSKPVILIPTCPLETGAGIDIWMNSAWYKLDEILTLIKEITGIQAIIKLHPYENIDPQVLKLPNSLSLNNVSVVKDYNSSLLVNGVDILITTYCSTFAMDGLAYKKPVILTDVYSMERYKDINVFYDGTTRNKLADALDSILSGLAKKHLENWKPAANYYLNGMEKEASKNIARILAETSKGN